MLIGAIANNVAVFQGGSSVMMTSYVPMMAAPVVLSALILFAVGALIACFIFLGTLVVAERERLIGFDSAGDLWRRDSCTSSRYSRYLGRNHPDPDLPDVDSVWVEAG